MRAAYWLLPLPFLVGAISAGLGACNSGTGDCPAKETITPGGSCSDDNLQCAFDLATPSTACDGTNTTIASSCICTKGNWVCPDPVSCGDAAPPPDETDGAGDEGSPDADEGDAAPNDDGAVIEAGDGGVDAATG